ncbi:hypothetical protein AB3X91_37875 [Paraburkholderia sp. BR14263]|uniref:hypothetical protein n=1 Tax=unclassified Paraburkholderia TaxID=2615204 RepID=UPI0034CEA83C
MSNPTDAKMMDVLMGKQWTPEQAEAVTSIVTESERVRSKQTRRRRSGSRVVKVAIRRCERIWGAAYTPDAYAAVLADLRS